MNRLFLFLSLIVLFPTCVMAQGHFSCGAGITYGTFTDEYVKEVYDSHPTFRGIIGYTGESLGIYAFADYGKISGNPFTKAIGGEYDFGDAGSELKMATIGIEVRAFLGESFYLAGEAGKTAIEELIWAEGLSGGGTKDGWSYGGGFGFEFPLAGTLKGDVSLRYTDCQISSEGKDIATGENAASLGKVFVYLGLKF